MPEVQDLPSPSEFIRKALSDRGMTQKDLAFILGVNDQAVNQLAVGKRGVSAEMAKALGAVFDVPAEYILRLQKNQEVDAELSRAADAAPEVLTKAKLVATYPVREMMKRGWISADTSLDEELAKFFGVESADKIEVFPHAAKRANATVITTPVQLAWMQRVKQIALGMLAARYSTESVKAAVSALRTLLVSEEAARKVPRILAEAGIRFILAECLPGAKIDGVCFWLDDASPVIAMSMRYDRIDNFWFVLRHECEHVLQMHGKTNPIVDAELEGERAGVGPNVPEEERVANAAAAEFCVPQDKLSKFISRKSPVFAERDFLGFCKTVMVHPGIAAGQLQHLTGRYDRFRSYQVKIRSIVAPGAVVDGWGDFAPVDI
jgi:HTH-type transcriptional regulator / antitoxin HigA